MSTLTQNTKSVVGHTQRFCPSCGENTDHLLFNHDGQMTGAPLPGLCLRCPKKLHDDRDD